jgi:hypothetical protein
LVSSVLLVRKRINLGLSSITCLEWSSITEEEEEEEENAYSKNYQLWYHKKIWELQSLIMSLIEGIVQIYMD